MELDFDQVQRPQIVALPGRLRVPWREGILLFALLSQASGALALEAPKERRPVDVAVYVVDISDIQERGQTVVADFAVLASWQQDELADPNTTELRTLSLDEVDSPRLFVINGRLLRQKFDDFAEVHPTGKVVYRQRYQGTLSIPMDLKDFP